MSRRAGWLVVATMVLVTGCARRTPEPSEDPIARAVPPPAGSPLAKVQVGMSAREVETVLGPPSDENAYMTGKAFIPFFYGRDRWRRAYFYEGMGRVVFAGGGRFTQNARVQRVEYDPNETGRAH